MGQAVLLVGLVAAAPPPPAAVPPEPSAADARFAQRVFAAVSVIHREHVRKPGLGELTAAAAGGLYAAVGRPVPNGLAERAGGTESEPALQEILARARAALGKPAALAADRDYLAAVAAAGRAADPYTAFTVRTLGTPGGSDLEFGLGFELDGLRAGDLDWLAYELEVAGGRRPTPPLPLPWRLGRVLPGGPAATAGLRPGDVITAMDGKPLTPELAGLAMARLLGGRAKHDDPDPGRPYQVSLTLTRAGVPKPITVRLDARGYVPECVFGYRRTPDGRWDYFPDPSARLAYIRVGFVEGGADEAFRAAVERVLRDRPAGLVLDLRWCPGGYVKPCCAIAAHLLPPGRPIYVERKLPHKNPVAGDLFADGPGTWAELPLAVLVSSETTGGGEMIAAALQDHKRAVLVGQRTFGRASVSMLQTLPFSEMRMRVTSGYSDRVNGQNRHRLPVHGPHDVWGVRPDPGCVVPVSADLCRQLRDWADRQALRTGVETRAEPLDDPLDDPQRVLADKLLKQRIAVGKP